MADALALSRLLQLASPLLPVGAYCYSQGLEWAIESGEVKDVATAQAWIGDSLQVYQARFELPLLYRLYQAWQANDMQQVQAWDHFYQAGRDTAEGWAETRQMGYSLRRLLNDLKPMSPALIAQVNRLETPAFPTLCGDCPALADCARTDAAWLCLGLAGESGQCRHESRAAWPGRRADHFVRSGVAIAPGDTGSNAVA